MTFSFNNLVKNISDTMNSRQISIALGNPLWLICILVIIFLFLLFLAFNKSGYKNKWRVFSIFALISIACIISAIFIHESFRKNNISQLIGSSEKSYKYDMPPAIFFESQETPQPINAENKSTKNYFDELFLQQ
jgi:D-alanyl-lipoteichoic acid acyltransferase DltB (MBOAT superfamily)